MPCPVCASTKVRNFSFGTSIHTVKNPKRFVVSNLVICANCGNAYDAVVGRCVFEEAIKRKKVKKRSPIIHI